MTNRADVDRLLKANKAIVKMARADLAALFAGMDLSRPELVRDALLDAVPALVREYGDLASAVAADWYEELRVAAAAKGVHREQLSPGADPEAVAGSVRAGAGGLFTGDVAASLAFIEGAMQRHISYSTRDTIRRNVATDPAKPRYARVPSGAKTCAFCTLLSSRGFVYSSKKTAGENPSDYHDDCVIEGTIVSGPAAVSATSRWYEGEVFTITAGTKNVTVTPNHPVLTARGWVRAKFVNQSDHLFLAESVERVIGGGPNEHQGPALVENRFSSLLMEADSARRCVPGSPEQFHGDGFASEVHVVTRNDLLGDEGDIEIAQVPSELLFSGGPRVFPIHGGSLFAEGGSQNGLVGPFGASDGIMSSARLRESLLGSHSVGSVNTCGASVSDLDPGLSEPSPHKPAGYALTSGDGVLTFAGQVPFQEVIRSLLPVATRTRVASVVGSFYSGNVYNLSTKPHWYLANSIVTHNCDCQIVADFDAEGSHIDGYDPDTMYEQYRAAYLAGDGSVKDTAAYMRRQNPEAFTDSLKPTAA